MSFELTFLGTSGGPLESNTCSIILKPTQITYETLSLDDGDNLNELLCIDAGSGMGKLTEIIHHESKTQRSKCALLDYYHDSEPIEYYYSPTVKLSTPFKSLIKLNSINYTKKIFNKLSNFIITHPHLDHVSSLVINSAGYTNKQNYIPKIVYGSKYTTDSIQTNYFNGITWPNMPSFNVLKLNEREFNTKFHIGNYSITMFPLSHGELNIIENEKRRSSSVTTIPPGINSKSYKKLDSLTSLNKEDIETVAKKHYLSSAYLIEMEKSAILVFGDFECDSISKLHYNLNIWKQVAPLILQNNLKCIILECSNGQETNEDELYGHLTPSHLISELKILKLQCGLEKFTNLNIIINHVKEPLLTNANINFNDPRKKILQDLNKLNKVENLGCNFSIALSGTSIIV